LFEIQERELWLEAESEVEKMLWIRAIAETIAANKLIKKLCDRIAKVDVGSDDPCLAEDGPSDDSSNVFLVLVWVFALIR
jgi:hypothetical protein